MARPGRELAITHGAQLAAQRLLGDDDAEFFENPLAEIDDPPAHDPMNRRNRAALDDRGERRELCRKLGDGVNQAADLISATASIPSLNFIPLTTFGNWF